MNDILEKIINSNKLKGHLTEEELLIKIESGEIQYISVCHPVLAQVFIKTFDAVFFAKSILNKSVKFGEMSMYFNIENNILETEYSNLNNTGDCDVVIDKSTFRIMSWQGDKYAICIGIAKSEFSGEPILTSPRNLLIRTKEFLEKKYGIYFQAASELEFYLLDKTNVEITKSYPEINLEKYKLSKRSSDFSVATIMSRNESFLKQIKDNIKGCGIELEGLFTEHGPGQHEVNIRYGDILKNCDNHLYLKQCIKQTAYQCGLGVSFMAKTYIDSDGSSSHVHISVYDKISKHNIFSPQFKSKENTFITINNNRKIYCNKSLLYFTAGILRYIKELFLLYAPTVNSYKRYKKNSFAPVYINTWGYDNRASAVRVVGSGDDIHLEIRIAGSDANPYILLIAIIASGMNGIENRLIPPQIIENLENQNREDLIEAPKNIYEAYMNFEKSHFATEILGNELKALILKNAQTEWDDFQNHISNFEINRYLDLV